MIPLALLIIAGAIVAIYFRVEVRLTLFLAALALGTLAGQTQVIVQTFFATFATAFVAFFTGVAAFAGAGLALVLTAGRADFAAGLVDVLAGVLVLLATEIQSLWCCRNVPLERSRSAVIA